MFLVTIKIDNRVKIIPKQTSKDVIELYARLSISAIKKGTKFKFMTIDRYTPMRTIEEYTFEFTPSGIELVEVIVADELPEEEKTDENA